MILAKLSLSDRFAKIMKGREFRQDHKEDVTVNPVEAESRSPSEGDAQPD
jgi:hypothetical protein